MSKIITKTELLSLASELLGSGAVVAAPTAASGGRFFFKEIKTTGPNGVENVVLDSSIMPVNSIKEFFFPQHEVLYQFERVGKDVELIDATPFSTPQVVFGARPCDAASLPILDKIFAWDYQDRFFQSRRENTTVVVIACKSADTNCFCTSVGLSPDTTSGADAVLLEIDTSSSEGIIGASGQVFEVRTITEKGEKLFAGKTKETADPNLVGKTTAPPEKRFDIEHVTKILMDNFDVPIFAETGLRCVGCGACTYVCPTCHCFDIVDEGSHDKGKRVKNWDTCQATIFTHHAS
ncbi:MAG: 4Fe-4S dicluster domain-containing protein, partial [Thermoguttaceae bacterium]